MERTFILGEHRLRSNGLKKWDDIFYDDGPLYDRKKAAISTVAEVFFQRVNRKTNVISGQEVSKLCRSFSWFSTSMWYNKTFLLNRTPIFGLKSGIVFDRDEIYFITGNGTDDYWRESILFFLENIRIEENVIHNLQLSKTKKSDPEDIELLHEFINELTKVKYRFNKNIEAEINEENQLKENRRENLVINQRNRILSFDKDGDGRIDLMENDFDKILTKNQKIVIEMNKTYIHQFIKVSNYLKTKKQNTQTIFESIHDTSSQEDLDERVNLLKNQIHAYELLVFHSLSMIGAIVSGNLITFYEIYESFDKLGMFNSNWENEVSERLTNIGDKLDELMYSIDSMERNIVSGLSQLAYVTQEGFSDLERSVTKELNSIDSSIKFNNLLTGISTYQLYKINKQTKPLLPK